MGMRALLIVILLGWISSPTTAEVTPTSKPLPAGLVNVDVSGRSVVTIESDITWIRTALEQIEPTTRPTTMPADLIARVDEIGPQVVASLKKDLAVDHPRPASTRPATTPATQPFTAETLISERIRPTLQKLNDLSLAVEYVVLPKRTLTDAVKTGWGTPRFYYNRLADDVVFEANIGLSLDAPNDAVPVPVIYVEGDDESAKAKLLVRAVHGMEAGVLDAISQRAGLTVESNLLDYIANEVVIPLNLSRDREWLGIGVIGVIGGKYSSQILGIDRDRWMLAATQEPPQTPVRFASIDLSNPVDPKDLRPEYFPYYVDTMRRKSTLVLWKLVQEKGDEAITQLLIRAIEKDPTLDEDLKQLTRE